jgi:catalase
LYEAIERGEFPTWTAYAQVVDPEDAPDLDFNILDTSGSFIFSSMASSMLAFSFEGPPHGER